MLASQETIRQCAEFRLTKLRVYAYSLVLAETSGLIFAPTKISPYTAES